MNKQIYPDWRAGIKKEAHLLDSFRVRAWNSTTDTARLALFLEVDQKLQAIFHNHKNFAS